MRTITIAASRYSLAAAALAMAAIAAPGAFAGEGYDWSKTSPVAFLSTLRATSGNIMYLDSKSLPPKGWVTYDDVGILMRSIDSGEPSAPVMTDENPTLPPKFSTVGHEAMFLIQGYRGGTYPPSSCSVGSFTPDRDEFKKWWQDERSRKRPPRIGAGVTVLENSPTRADIIADSKPFELSLVDALVWDATAFQMGAANINILVNRLTGAVDYVWSPPYQLYIKPQYAMPNIQDLYERSK